MKITMSELKKMVKEEMMRESKYNVGRSAYTSVSSDKKVDDSKKGGGLGLKMAGLSALTVFSAYCGEKCTEAENKAFQKGAQGEFASPVAKENCIKALKTGNTIYITSLTTNEQIGSCLGFIGKVADKEIGQLKKKVPDLDLGSLQTTASELLQNFNKTPMKESRSVNATKITLSELKQLVRSELKRSGLV